MTSFVLFALATQLALPAVGRQGVFDGTLDPENYGSPSGELRLRVDPSERFGRGEGTYRLEREGLELWSGTRPFTLFGAAVSDEGLVAGYSYAAGRAGGEGDELLLVLLEASGRTRWMQRFERDGIVSCLGSTDPDVLDLWMEPDRDRLVVRVLRGQGGTEEEWWTFSLSTGAAGARVQPRARMSGDERLASILAVERVPETPWTLVHWLSSQAEPRRRGATFALVDSAGDPLWRIDWPEDYTVASDERAESRLLTELRERGAISGMGAGRFALRCVARGERVSFQVTPLGDGSGAWSVSELGREAFVPPAGEPALPALPELRHLGTITLELDEEVESIYQIALGADDRIHALDVRTDTVHVLERDGQALFACRPAPADLEQGSWDQALSVDEAGSIFLSLGDESAGVFVHFDAAGKRLGANRLTLDPMSQRRYAQARGRSSWVVALNALHLVDPAHQLRRTIERAPDGSWLRGTSTVALAPDGSLALVVAPDPLGPPKIAIFSGEGEPLGTLAAPEDFQRWGPIAFDGERVALRASGPRPRSADLVLMRADGSDARRTELPFGSQSWTPLFPRTGPELWFFDGERAIERYALP